MPHLLIIGLLALGLSISCNGQRAGEEITFPSDAFKKLDTFEALNLEDADKLYLQKDYKGAFAAYKAYSFEFPKSQATPYVLLRMGRCLELLEKRNAATKAYQDVVDYFPDSVRYAAAALFYIGQCHGQNGDTEKQTAVWARLVKDDNYVQQPNSGTALTHLGEAMQKLGKFEEAATYQWRTAVAFRQSNPQAAAEARNAVIEHYALRQPNHEQLSKFYTEVGSFENHAKAITKAPEEITNYWTTALTTALSGTDEDQREAACAYWTAKLGSRHADDDELRKTWCDAMLAHEKKTDLWRERMEQQFAAKPATIERVLQWCAYFNKDEAIQAAFYEKHGSPIAKSMNQEQRIDLMKQLSAKPLEMHEYARSVMRGIDTRGMDDQQLVNFINFAANYESEETVLSYVGRLKDKTTAAKTRFDYYLARSHRNRPNMEKALAEIPVLQKSTDHAGGELKWHEANLLKGLSRYEEAIKAYRSANRQPQSTWEIADCLVAMKQYPEAIKTVRELESVGGDTASQASLRIAEIHRAAGDKAREVDQLRIVLKRYPKSRQSSDAHNRLESYGVALIGGESEAEE